MFVRLTLSVLVTLGLVACGSDSSAPASLRAEAGADRFAFEGATVTLAATAVNADGPVAFAWTQRGGEPVALSDSNSAAPTFIVPAVETLGAPTFTFEVEVTAGQGVSRDAVTITGRALTAFAYAIEGSAAPEGFLHDLGSGASSAVLAPGGAPARVVDLVQLPDGSLLRTIAAGGATWLQRSERDGSGVVTLVDAAGALRIEGPVLSPDGARCAFHFGSADPSTHGVWALELDGSGEERVLEFAGLDVDVTDIRWTPDGARLVVLTDTAGARRLLARSLGEASTALLSPLVAPGRGVSQWQISPDATTVTYLSDDQTEDSHRLYVSRLDGTLRTAISSFPVPNGTVESFQWAPGGSALAFRSSEDTGAALELFVHEPAANATRVLREPGTVLDATAPPLWTSDGARIVWTARPTGGGASAVYAAAPDGSSRVQLDGPVSTGGDARHLAVVGQGPVVLEVRDGAAGPGAPFLVDAAGGVATPLAPPLSASTRTDAAFAATPAGPLVLELRDDSGGYFAAVALDGTGFARVDAVADGFIVDERTLSADGTKLVYRKAAAQGAERVHGVIDLVSATEVFVSGGPTGSPLAELFGISGDGAALAIEVESGASRELRAVPLEDGDATSIRAVSALNSTFTSVLWPR